MRRFCLLFALLLTSVFATDDLSLRTRPDKAVLVLKTGRIITGQLLSRPQGVEVVLPSGRMFIGNEQIHLRASSLDDAYQQMVASRPETVDGHVRLARWCQNNKLMSQARQEVLHALHLDPQRLELRQMLESMTAREEQAATDSSSVGTPEELLKRMQHIHMRERRSLAGLPEDLALTFTQRIQPILSNKCSNTKCHGSEDHGFFFQSVRRGTTNIRTEQNMAEVMKAVRQQADGETSLMKHCRTIHGGMRNHAFVGQIGRSQLATVQKWVAAFQEEHGLTTSTLPSSKIETVSSVRPVERRDAEFLRDARSVTRRDAFDPDVFNLKYHGRRRTNGFSSSAAAPVHSTPTYLPVPIESKPVAKGSKL